MLKSLPLERIYRDSRCGSLMLPWTAEICIDRSARRRCTSRARRTIELHLADLIDRNAAFARTSRRFAFLARRDVRRLRAAHRGGRTGAAVRARVQRGDRVAILALNHPDYSCCSMLARGSAHCVRCTGGRLPEQMFILSDASIKALIVEQGFSGIIAPLKAALPDIRIVGLDFTPSFEQLLAQAAAKPPIRMSISLHRC